MLPWLNNYTFPEEAKFEDKEYAKNIYSRFIKEIYKNGTTRVAAFATTHKDSTSILIDLFIESGLGAYIGKVNIDRNCCDSLCEVTSKSIEDTVEIINNFIDKSHLVKPIITPRFVPTCSDELLRSLGSLAVKYMLPVQSHLSENLDEIKWVKELHPNSNSYSEVYNKYKLFGDTPTLMAHCIHLSDKEIEHMSKKMYMQCTVLLLTLT